MNRIISLLILTLCSAHVAAQNVDLCSKVTNVPVGSNWSGIQKQANDARDAFCEYAQDKNDDNHLLFGEKLRLLVDAIRNQSLLPDTGQTASFFDDIVRPEYGYYYVPSVIAINNAGRDVVVLSGKVDKAYHPLNGERTEHPISDADLAACNCFSAYQELRPLFEGVFVAQAMLGTQGIKDVMKIDAVWSNFLDNARQQTYFDIGATTLFNRWFDTKQPSDGFDAPPARQWFAFHPNIVIDNVGAAADGQELKESIALEIVGVNWWKDEGCLSAFSCGVSVTLNYADREGVKSTGIGLMFTIENKYNIGVVRYGNDTGVFVTIDLLALFKDEKSQYADYQAYIKSRQ